LLEREQAEAEAIERSATEAARQAEQLSAALVEQRFAEQEQAALAAIEATLLGLVYDAAQHQEADTKATELAHFDVEHQQLETARLLMATLAERTRAAERQCAELHAEIARLTTELAGYESQLTGADEARRRHAALASELRDQEARHAQAQAQAGALKQQLTQLDELADERRTIAQEIADVALDADALKELAGAFGRNGIQALIIDTVLPELSDEANALLRRMSTGAMQVEMRTQRELQTRDAVTETLDIIIRDEFGERPYDLYSGGEAFRINFAIRVALAKLLARRAGATIEMLVIDEGFGTQDSRGRDGIVEALQSVADDFSSIIVITHIDELRDLFPSRIEVVKTADGSRVSVI
jgi:exonuclease SbcC